MSWHKIVMKSRKGRWFIANRTLDAIKQKPIFGYGKNGFRNNYMDFQAEYFRLNPNDPNVWLADDIQHPLNEYMLVWFEYGLVGLIVFVLIISFPIITLLSNKAESNRTLGYCTIIIAVFSLFSYPFCYPLTWVVLLASLYESVRLSHLLHIQMSKQLIHIICYSCILVCSFAMNVLGRSFHHNNEWGCAYKLALKGRSTEALSKYRKLFLTYKDPFLYSYAMEAFLSNNTDEAFHVANLCRRQFSSYNLELLLGDIAKEKQNYKEAIQHYTKANNMCPVRFAPYEGLLQSFSNIPDGYNQAKDIAIKIRDKPIKVNSKEIEHIKNKALEFLDKNSCNN